jgi:hypothetical protein
MMDDGRWVFAASEKGIVAIWQEDVAEPSFFRFANRDAELDGIVTRDGVIYLGVRVGDNALELLPLPTT